MDYSMRKKIEAAAKNKYEAVIVASKLARKINDSRVVAQEQLGPDAPLPSYANKVTTEAIIELAEGKVKYVFKESASSEEEDFLE